MSTHYFETHDWQNGAVARNETLFTVANGTLGLRGDFEEKTGTVHKGTYINGFYDTEPIVYGESAYGFAENHQTILNLPDPKRIDLEVNGYPFSLESGSVLAFCMRLEFTTGVMRRTVDWQAPDGTEIRIEADRLASFDFDGGAALRYRVMVRNGRASLRLVSAVDTATGNLTAEEDPRVGAKFSSTPLRIRTLGQEGTSLTVTAETRNSGLCFAGSIRHRIGTSRFTDLAPAGPVSRGDLAGISWVIELEAGEWVQLEKYISYQSGVRGSLPAVSASVLRESLQLSEIGIVGLINKNRAWLARFWETAQIEIGGDQDTEQAIAFNLFHLVQSAGRNSRTSIAAKGLTAEGYEGHYFWDTEAYICPLFTYTLPEVAASLLAYRHNILDHARARARIMSLDGALYPWRTIGGEETSAYYPAGTAQYHINADIMYAVRKLLAAAGPSSFPFEKALEMAVETARMWASLGTFIPSRGGRFCINGVTGPDEYTAVVNNNVYTNLMARENFLFALELLETHSKNKLLWPKDLPAVSDTEAALWKKAADLMWVPYDAGLGVHPQDDSFMDKAEWDFAGTPRSRYPLLLHFHPLVIYRHKVLKQPDLVLAEFLLSDQFSLAQKKRDFAYYEPLTTGDSSLSHCIQSIMACETGESGKAWDYFNKTARLDIEDLHGNSSHGIHTASMAGSWMTLVYGFAGFRDYGGKWRFAPSLPSAWNRLSFRLRLAGCVLHIEMLPDTTRYTLESGAELTFAHRTETCLLRHGESRAFSSKPVFRAALFDLDGVITDTAELHYQAWQDVCDKAGLRFDRSVNEQLRGVSREESFRIVLAHNNRDMPAAERQTWIDQKNRHYVELLDRLSSTDILPGIEDLLRALRERGIKTVLASASRNAPLVLERLGIGNLFDHIADISCVAMSKPEPDIFLAGAELAGVWPGDCVGIEDAQAGVDAINRAGMRSVAVGTGLSGAMAVVPDTSCLTADFLFTLF